MHDPRAYGINVGDEIMTSDGVQTVAYIAGGLIVADNGQHIDFAKVKDPEAKAHVLKSGAELQARPHQFVGDLSMITLLVAVWVVIGYYFFFGMPK